MFGYPCAKWNAVEMFARWYSDTLHNKRISRACTPQYQWWWWFVGSIKMSLSHTRIRLALGATRSIFLFFWFWSLQVDADFVCSVRISQKRTLFYYLVFFSPNAIQTASGERNDNKARGCQNKSHKFFNEFYFSISVLLRFYLFCILFLVNWRHMQNQTVFFCFNICCVY